MVEDKGGFRLKGFQVFFWIFCLAVEGENREQVRRSYVFLVLRSRVFFWKISDEGFGVMAMGRGVEGKEKFQQTIFFGLGGFFFSYAC